MRKIILCFMALGLFACEKEREKYAEPDSIIYNPSTSGGKIFASAKFTDGNEGLVVLRPDGSRNTEFPIVSSGILLNCGGHLPKTFSLNQGIGVTGEGVVFTHSENLIAASIQKRYDTGTNRTVAELGFIFQDVRIFGEIEKFQDFLPVAINRAGDPTNGFAFTDVEAITLPLDYQDPTEPLEPQDPVIQNVANSIGSAADYYKSFTQVFAIDNDNKVYATVLENNTDFSQCNNLYDLNLVLNLHTLVPNGVFKMSITSSWLYFYEAVTGKVFRFAYKRNGILKRDNNFYSNGYGNVGTPHTILNCTTARTTGFCITALNNNNAGSLSGEATYLLYDVLGTCNNQVMTDIGTSSSLNRDHKIFGTGVVIDNSILKIYDLSGVNSVSFDTFKL